MGGDRILFVTMGLPGCGKTTWAKKNFERVVSTDCRRDGVVLPFHEKVLELLDSGDVATDGCNVGRGERLRWIETARNAGAKCALVVFFNAEQTAKTNIRGIEQCRMDNYLEKFRQSVREVMEEGWDLIVLERGG